MEGYPDSCPIPSFGIAMPTWGHRGKFALPELHKKVIPPIVAIPMGELRLQFKIAIPTSVSGRVLSVWDCYPDVCVQI